MFQRSEGRFKSHDESELFYQLWGVPKPVGNIVVTHGHGEHSDCYKRLVDAFDGLNLNIYSWDLRGHGRSSGQRGYAASFSDYVKDYQFFLKKLTLEKSIVGKPLILIGHSMGGLVQMKALCEFADLPVSACVYSAPMFGIAFPVPPIKDKAAQWLNQILPRLTLGNEISYDKLTRDEEVLREFETDPLRHNKMSSGVYLGSLQAMSFVRASCARIKYPSLFQMSDNDPVTNFQSANEVFEKISSANKEFKVYSNFKHEIYNDKGREEVFADLLEFLKKNVSI